MTADGLGSAAPQLSNAASFIPVDGLEEMYTGSAARESFGEQWATARRDELKESCRPSAVSLCHTAHTHTHEHACPHHTV